MPGVAVGAVALGLALVAALHGLRPDLPVAAHRLSEYANGPHAWMMTAAFLALAAGAGALAAAIRRRRQGSVVDAAVAGLVFAAAGLVLSAVFPTGRSTQAEAVHSLASGAATVTIVVVAAAWSLWSPAPVDRCASQRLLAAAGVAAAIASPWVHDTGVTGIGQRLLWALLAAWMIRAGMLLATTSQDEAPSPTPVIRASRTPSGRGT